MRPLERQPSSSLANFPAITVYLSYTWNPGSNFSLLWCLLWALHLFLAVWGWILWITLSVVLTGKLACSQVKVPRRHLGFFLQEGCTSDWCLPWEFPKQVISLYFWFRKEGFNYVLTQIQYSRILTGPTRKFSCSLLLCWGGMITHQDFLLMQIEILVTGMC